MATDTQQLRDSLIRSLQNEPLLIEAEMSLHSSTEPDMTGEFRQAVAMSLRTAPPMAKAQREGFRSLEGDLIEQFRTAMHTAVSSGANLAAREKELLQSLDLEKLGEFRSRMDTHLESGPEISQEDLAIYVPSGYGITEEFRRSLAQQPSEVAELEQVEKPEISAEPDLPKHRSAHRYAPGAFVPAAVHAPDEELELDEPEGRASQPYVPGAYVDRVLQEDQEELEPASVELEPEPASAELEVIPGDPIHTRANAALVAASLRAGMEGEEASQTEGPSQPATSAPAIHGLTAVPTLTAALEAIGPIGEDFGFLVRYGRYAPEGRRSEFLVGGLGLSELSKRLTSWLESHASLEDQVQVIDEGSGELTIYLVGAEKQY
ncbi:MAG: hypothetical protein ACC700_12695 [Anaerolineales bacterium]